MLSILYLLFLCVNCTQCTVSTVECYGWLPFTQRQETGTQEFTVSYHCYSTEEYKIYGHKIQYRGKVKGTILQNLVDIFLLSVIVLYIF